METSPTRLNHALGNMALDEKGWDCEFPYLSMGHMGGSGLVLLYVKHVTLYRVGVDLSISKRSTHIYGHIHDFKIQNNCCDEIYMRERSMYTLY
jgi:hypothetical protein